MLMTFFKWEARILNKLYKTQRYDKLTNLNIKSPEEINYSIFFELTPGINSADYNKMIESSNKLCRPNTRAIVMQQEVAFLDQFMRNLYKTQALQSKQDSQAQQNKQIQTKQSEPKFKIEHVVVYSTLSKCRIWPKVLKSGAGFVPTLINFYNNFTKQYNDWLEFKFDPAILTQKYTKIMKKVNMKKRDHPKLVEAVTNSNIAQIKRILLQTEQKQKNKQINKKEQQEQNEQNLTKSILNNIWHKGKSITHICCEYSSLETIKYIVEMGGDFQILDDQKQTAIFYAVKRADMNILRYLVEELKVNINHRQYQERTIFYLAAFEGNLEIVDYLYKKGANPELSSKLDRTPLSKACYLGNIPVVKYLLSINVDMLKQDNKGRTALHNAAWGIEGGRDGKRRGHIMLEDSPECGQLLILAGHPVDIQDYDGFTPLFSAVSSIAVRSLRLLLKYNANIHHETKNKQNAVFIAAKYGHLPMLKILIEQFKLNYLAPDFQGYTPICASATLQTSESFKYLCDLYMENNVQLQIEKIILSCLQYDTSNNIQFFIDWILQKKDLTAQQYENGKKTIIKTDLNKIIYLSKFLQRFRESLNSLKKKESQLRQYLSKNQAIKGQLHKLQNTEPNKNEQKTKLKQQLKERQQLQKYQLFEKVIKQKLQQQDLTQDKQVAKGPEKVENNRKREQSQENKQKNKSIAEGIVAASNIKAEKLKQIQATVQMFNSILELTAIVIMELQNHKKQLAGSDTNGQNKQILAVIDQVQSIERYKQTANHIMNEYIKHFNKGKQFTNTDIVEVILNLAKIINPENPTVPAQVSGSQQETTQKIRIGHNQTESDLIKIITNRQVITNLVCSVNKIYRTLLKLVRNRHTAIIMAMVNSGQGVGKVSHKQLIKIITATHPDLQQESHPVATQYPSQTNQTSNPNSEGNAVNKMVQGQHHQHEQKISLIKYCMMHGISDIGVYLQQICKAPLEQEFVSIPQYQIQKQMIAAEQNYVELDPVEQWTFQVKQILARMGDKQKQIYNRTLNHPQQQKQKQKPIFKSCKEYKIVNTVAKLEQMRQNIKKSVLVGIDIEYHNGIRQGNFVCTIQIGLADVVYVVDPLSHLIILPNIEQNNKLKPIAIANFIRQLMADSKIIKIFHAYENDVRWIHQDFGIFAAPHKPNNGNAIGHRNRNVFDTSKLYSLCHRTNKGESPGLKTVCQHYLGYNMDKKFQKSEWRMRPLFKQMIEYAAIDAEVLPHAFLKILSAYNSNEKIMDKIKQGFTTKRIIKTQGVRNRPIPVANK